MSFSLTRNELNLEYVGAQNDLDLRKLGYESGFDRVSGPDTDAPPKISFAHIEWTSPDREAIIARHHEVLGQGKSYQDAIDDWQKHLATKPQCGDFLHWRVRPEIDWQYDFASQTPTWRVYARFAIA